MTALRTRRSATAVLEGLLLAAVVAAVLLGVVRPLVGPAGLAVGTGPVFGAAPSVEATLDVRRVDVRTEPVLPGLAQQGEVPAGEAVEATVPTRTTIAVWDPDARQLLGLVGSQVLGGLLAVVLLVGLLLLVRSLRQGDPFVPANARRLYVMAVAVGLGGQVAVLLHAWGRSAVVSGSPLAPYLVQDTEISVLPLLAGLAIAVAAEVFRQGTALRRDVQGLV